MSFRGPRIRATKSPYQYPYMQYPYQNVGTQLTWRDSPPMRTRGADAASLGNDGYELPLPGAPEVIPEHSGYSGTDCGGNCGKPCCGPHPLAGEELAGTLETLIKPAAVAAGLYLLYKALIKKKRR